MHASISGFLLKHKDLIMLISMIVILFNLLVNLGMLGGKASRKTQKEQTIAIAEQKTRLDAQQAKISVIESRLTELSKTGTPSSITHDGYINPNHDITNTEDPRPRIKKSKGR